MLQRDNSILMTYSLILTLMKFLWGFYDILGTTNTIIDTLMAQSALETLLFKMSILFLMLTNTYIVFEKC